MRHDARWVSFPVDGTAAHGYLARPAVATAPLPAVIVIQEIWGVDAHVQDLVQRFATAGYVALAPDLYSRGGKPDELAPERVEAAKAFLDALPSHTWFDAQARVAALERVDAAARERLRPTLDRLFSPARPIERWVEDLRAAVAFVAASREARGRRIGAVGYCMGGLLSALLAAEERRLSASVVYYGAAPSAEKAAAIRCPVLGIYGGDDPRVLTTVPQLAEGLRNAGQPFEQLLYTGAPHAFFNDTRSSYRPEAARDAWARTLRFLSERLTPT